MSPTTQQIVINGFVTPLTATAPSIALAFYQHIFEETRHKIYSLAFWMTDNEITAEEISSVVFTRTFSRGAASPEAFVASLDANLIATLREFMPIGVVTLQTAITNSKPIFGNTKRIH